MIKRKVLNEIYSQRKLYYRLEPQELYREFERMVNVYSQEQAKQNPRRLVDLILMEKVHEMWEKFDIQKEYGVTLTKFFLDLGMVRLSEEDLGRFEEMVIPRLEARVLRLMMSYHLEDVLEEPIIPNKYFEPHSSSFATH